MNCLSREECNNWLRPSGITISQDGSLELDGYVERDLSKVFLVLPKDASGLQRLAEALAGWLPPLSQKLLLLTAWSLYPPHEKVIFDRIRISFGEGADLSNLPGHLFLETRDGGRRDYDDRTNEDINEESTLVWMVYLVLLVNWCGYLFSRNSRDLIYLGDGYVGLYSENTKKITRIVEIADKLQVRTQDRPLWT